MSSNNAPTGGSSAHLPTAHSTADLRAPGKVEADDAVGIGQVIDNRYRILAKLGEGGMGEVYAAEHVHIEKKVAMKLLRSEILSNKEAVARFYQEARSASSIGHENIIGIEDFGTLPDGRIYLCMELLDGKPLNDLMEEGQLAPERILDILIQTCHGLAAAHAKNIVHRDMKPENIFVTNGSDGRDIPKLLDFGIAKVQGTDGDNNLTKTGTIFGTPFYMAPEQALGQGIDHRVDVYAMGVIIYEIFTGTVPFQGESFMGVLTMHITAEPESPSVRAASNGRQLLPGVEPIILRALKKEQGDRYQSMDELTTDLVNLRRSMIGAGMSAYMEPHVVAPSAGMSALPPAHATRPPAHTPMPMQAGQSASAMHAHASSAGMPQYAGASASMSASASHSGMYGAGDSMAMPKKKGKGGAIAAIVIVLLVAAGIAGFVLMSPGKEGKAVSQNSGQTAGTNNGNNGNNNDNNGNNGNNGTDNNGTAGTDNNGTDNNGTAGTAGTDNNGTDNNGTAGTAGTDNGTAGTDNNATDPVTVLLFSSPDGATVLQDGKKLGKTPLNVSVNPGQPVKLTLKRRKYRDKKITLDGSSTRERVRLARKRSSTTKPPKDTGTGTLGLGLEN